MNDGNTRRLTTSGGAGAAFLAENCASLVVLEGSAAGSEYLLTSASYVIGRSSGADVCLLDDSASGNHAAIELGGTGFKIRDMGSTNGTFVNGSRVESADLKHGDKITVGAHTLQYLQEKKERTGSYDLSDEFQS